jgi:hypothetical protein
MTHSHRAALVSFLVVSLMLPEVALGDVQWASWLRSSADLGVDAPDRDHEGIASPKLSLRGGPWRGSDLYLDAAIGFHVSESALRSDSLVRARGAELGLRTRWTPRVESRLSLWWLDTELGYLDEAGAEPTRPSRRYAVELAASYAPAEWLRFDADLSLPRASFRDGEREGSHFRGAPDAVMSAGVTLHDLGSISGGVGVRWFGARPLAASGSARSAPSVQLSGRIDYAFGGALLSLEALHLLGPRAEIDDFSPSLLRGESAGAEVEFESVAQTSLRVSLTARF